MVKSDPTSKAELEDALDKLIGQAHQNGVEITDGGYVSHHTATEAPDIEVMVYRLAESSENSK